MQENMNRKLGGGGIFEKNVTTQGRTQEHFFLHTDMLRKFWGEVNKEIFLYLSIESSWRALKRRLSRGGIKKDEYGLHFAEYLWFQRYSEDSFLSMDSHIAEIY